MTADQPWRLSWRADPEARAIADRHYNRQSVGSAQFVPPGRCLVLTTPDPALWVTSWPFGEYVKHAWPGAWMCSAFRNEGEQLSSTLVTAAVAATRWTWPDVPDLGMVTFVDPSKTRRKRDPGRCFRRAGFIPVGETKGGLVALQLLPEDMPEPLAPIGRDGQPMAAPKAPPCGKVGCDYPGKHKHAGVIGANERVVVTPTLPGAASWTYDIPHGTVISNNGTVVMVRLDSGEIKETSVENVKRERTYRPPKRPRFRPLFRPHKPLPLPDGAEQPELFEETG